MAKDNRARFAVAYLVLMMSAASLAIFIYVKYNQQYIVRERFIEKEKKKNNKKSSKVTASEICIGGFCMPKYYIEAEIAAMDNKTKKTLMDMLKKEPYI